MNRVDEKFINPIFIFKTRMSFILKNSSNNRKEHLRMSIARRNYFQIKDHNIYFKGNYLVSDRV